MIARFIIVNHSGMPYGVFGRFSKYDEPARYPTRAQAEKVINRSSRDRYEAQRPRVVMEGEEVQ